MGRSEISIDPLHAYLSAKIGDGRHISSEARTRPLFADRATGRLRRSRSNMLYFFHVPLACAERNLTFYISLKPKCDDRRRPPYFERSENAAPIRRSSDGQQIVILSFFIL